jgi:hypothetical protein
MWLMTPLGFYSAVQKQGTDLVTVRSRVRADLDRLRERHLPSLGATVAGAGTDYPYRATCTHQAWAEALAGLARELDYPNFKSAVAQRQGSERARVYGRVWQQLLELEREEA